MNRTSYKKLYQKLESFMNYALLTAERDVSSQISFPDKAVLPLNDFAEFYFKERKGSLDEKISVACNDSFCRYFEESTMPYIKRHAYKQRVDHLSGYLQKVLFSRFVAKDYVKSNRKATQMLDSYLNSWADNEMKLYAIIRLACE